MRALAILSCLVCMAPIVAVAQGGDEPPAPDFDDEEARGLFEAGRAAFQAGRFDDALGHFQRAYDLSQRPMLLFNIGSALDRLRQDEEALRTFEAFLQQVPDAPNRQEVEGRVQILLQAIAERAEPDQDGEVGEDDPFADEPFEDSDVMRPEPAGGPMWAWVAAAGAVAFAGAAVGFWLAGDSEFDELSQSCGATSVGCDDEQVSTLETYDALTTAFLVGSLAAAGGAALLFFVESAPSEETVTVGLGLGGAHLRGRF